MSGWDFSVPSWSDIEQRLSRWGDAMQTGIAGGLDRMGAAAQMPWRRIRCLRAAMWEGQATARANLLHRFADIDIQAILPGLLDAVKEMVMILAGTTAAGGAIGAAAGAFAGGVGAVPGAVGGAAIGLEVGGWILTLLGLKAIGEFVLANMSLLIDKYKRGIAIAWSGPQNPSTVHPLVNQHDLEQEAIHRAAKEFAAADEALVVLLLAGIAAYLLHNGGKAVSTLAREVSAGKLGDKFGDWLSRNAGKLQAREDLRIPKRGGEPRGEGEGRTNETSGDGKNTSPELTKQQKIDNIVQKIGSDIKNNPLREEYESRVNGLQDYENLLRQQNMDESGVAQAMHQARRDLGVEFKNVTPEPLRDYIYDVNQSRYGDPLGPKFEDLVEKYNGDYSKIIDAAKRPNPDVNKLLGGFSDWLGKQPASKIEQYSIF